MPQWFMDGADDFVQKNMHLLPLQPELVLLTGEYTPFNLMVNGEGNITGMIDFGDSMTGFNEYDFLGPIMFLAGGDKRLISALLNGYGYPKDEQNENLQKRLMLLQILHRYSDFDAQLRIKEWRTKSSSIEELMKLAFPM